MNVQIDTHMYSTLSIDNLTNTVAGNLQIIHFFKNKTQQNFIPEDKDEEA